jgi:hypothetical protein
MNRRLTTALLLFIAVLAPLRAEAAGIDWRPRKTWVFIVGTLEWEDSESFESFPKENRRDAQLVRFFRDQGVPSDHIVYLADRRATTSRVQTGLETMLARTGEGDLLFFYFTGHGYQSDDGRKTYFATYDASDEHPGLSADAIVRTIARQFHGDRVVLAADCCYSGALADRVRRLDSSLSFACFASSTSKESSTGSWTFTEMLLAALRGRAFADLDDDGTVTLGELARSVRDDMRFAEEQVSTSILTGEFDDDTPIASAAPRRDRAIGRRVEVKSEGDWYKARIIDAKNGRYLVHYYGYEAGDDEWVRTAQLRTAR